MTSLALKTTGYLEDEWFRLRRFVLHGRTQTVRDHANKLMRRIEDELMARKPKTK